jgi:hypothetical protein
MNFSKKLEEELITTTINNYFMPNSNDNQDLKEQPADKQSTENKGEKAGAQSDENNFTSDNQKGKKVDADPSKESDKPGHV